MRDRAEFVAMASAMGMQPVKNGSERREHVAALVATAEALADALGLPGEGAGPGGGPAAGGHGPGVQATALAHHRELVVENATLREQLARLAAQALDLESKYQDALAAVAAGKRGGR